MAAIERAQAFEFDWSIPVLVVGAGACGMTAALAASEAGAEVLVLEQDARPSGSTGMSYGAVCAAGTRLQQGEGINDEAQWLFEDILAVTKGQTSERLARTLADNCGPAVDWLVSRHGLELTVVTAWTGLGHRQPRLHAPHSRSGEHLMGMLLQALQKAGVDVLTEARVTTLLVDASDRVAGVRIQRPDGSEETLGCETLVLATCGFGDNEEWVARYIPELADARYYGHEGNRGDGIAWGRELGAACADMGSFQALGSLAHPQSLVIPHTLLIGGGVQVNQAGRRFEDELDDISGQALTILKQPGGVCWMVYDQRLHEQALQGFQEYRDAAEMNTPKKAGSWAALAAATGMPVEAFVSTMQGVEHLAEEGGTDEYGRRFQAAHRLEPPFYATRVTGALFHTQGGLVVDENARVLREDGSALPNLWAGGGAACSVSGPGGWAYLPGMGLCTAVTLGRLAGQAAAQQALSGEPPA
jgi:fumarate reductase flavoprotein subunit